MKTKRLVESHNVITLKADKTRESPEIDRLLVELGNEAKAIPFYAIFPAGGGEPILLEGIVPQGQILQSLKEAGPSRSADVVSTAMKTKTKK